MHPRHNDTLRSYWHRVKYTTARGVKSNMDEYCMEAYGLRERHGVGLDQLHQAEQDAYCCHLLMTEYAALVKAPQAPPVYPSADTKADRRAAPPRVAPLPAARTPGRRVRGQRNS
jgi:DNA polymerase III epsilon subunit-like protein